MLAPDDSGPARASPLLSNRTAVRDVELITAEVQQSVNARGSTSEPAPCAASSAAGQRLCRRNIRAMFAFQLLAAMAWGTAMGPVFDRYLYLLGTGWARGPKVYPVHGANSLVGVAESISGLTSLVIAIPVGFLVDRNPERRARLLRMSTVLGLGSALVGIVAVLTDELMILTLMLVLFGAFSELSNSASEAIFADSIPAGERSGLFVTKGILSTVGSACGPGLSALGLSLLGDKWQPYQVKAVIISGLVMMIPTVAPLFVFNDPPGDAEKELQRQAQQSRGAADASAGESNGHGDQHSEESAQHSSPSEQQDAAGAAATVDVQRRFGPFRAKHIPILLAVSDFITCIGAGMTVKFFNLFFIQDHHFSPVAISLLQTIYPLVIAVFMKLTQGLAKPLGRPQASLLFFSTNVLCLFLLGEVTWLPILIFVFLVRGGFANATYPIDRSILMDFTPSSQRGLWNAVASLTSMTWSGSAFIGGLLSDAHDYRFTFLITALVYATACCVYVPLLWLVPRKEQDAASSSHD